jgi:hypothetical protein
VAADDHQADTAGPGRFEHLGSRRCSCSSRLTRCIALVSHV